MFYLKILLSYLLIQWLHLAQSAREPPITTIADQGMIQAVFLKLYRTQSVIAYLGLPYAHSPVNEKRFAPPIVDALPSWSGVRNSTMMPVCWQNVMKPKAKHSEVFHKLLNKMIDMDKMMDVESQQYDEDCLYLNIFIPDGECLWKFLLSSLRCIQVAHQCRDSYENIETIFKMIFGNIVIN